MLNKYLFSAIIAVLCLSGCNKDNDILSEFPEDPENPEASAVENPLYTIIEYTPAPGQFINEPASGYRDVTTPEAACRYATERLNKHLYVSLGAYGGYIIFKLKSPIGPSDGYDFAIAGNAIDTSNEPGIVWVMEDINNNGKPDDHWYQLRGSHFGKEGFLQDCSVTYVRPSEPRSPVSWTDSDGNSGEVAWLGSFHSQSSYYPDWISEDSYTLAGSRLPARAEYNEKTGQWRTNAFEWGYVDNLGEDSEIKIIDGVTMQLNHFRLSDAMDANGSAVEINKVDFIKVQSAVNYSIGNPLGEVSTEVCGLFKD